MMQPSMGLSATLTPRLIKPHIQRPAKVHEVFIPGIGRIGFTRDPGEGAIFGKHLLETNLMATISDRKGKVLDRLNLGSGKVTNIGVTALANDAAWAAPSGEAVNTFAVCKWHAWGTGTSEATTDYKVGTLAAPTTENAVEGTNSLEFLATGNAKLISKATITAESTLSITEWGLHSTKALSFTAKAATAASSTTLTDATNKPWTASSSTARGEQNKVLWAEKAEEVYGLITKSTTEVLTIPGWVKAAAAEAGATPEATSKYKVLPVLFDHRKFSSIGVESGNKISFEWILTCQSGS